jgi:hypothetical protein
MKRKFLFLTLAGGAAVILSAHKVGDELVRNGGFELIDGKLSTYDQLKLAMGWSNCTIGLSEVFTKTASAKTIGIPVNDYGTMEPKEGEHYAGFFAWKDDMRKNWGAGNNEDPFEPGWAVYSEYLQSELMEPLVEGKTYELSFWVALSGNSDRAVSSIGAYCSPVLFKENNRKFLSERPQVATEKILNAKGEWIQIKDTFMADGGERYLIIGVFPYMGFEAQNMTVDYDNKYAYYYLDGISLKQVEPVKE